MIMLLFIIWAIVMVTLGMMIIVTDRKMMAWILNYIKSLVMIPTPSKVMPTLLLTDNHKVEKEVNRMIEEDLDDELNIFVASLIENGGTK